MSNRSIAAAVALLAFAGGCFASADEEDPAATAVASDALVGGQAPAKPFLHPDAPMPLDYPLPVPSIRLPAGSLAHSFALEPDEWERNPRGFGCYVHYVTIWEPRGTRLEVPITVCP